MKCPREGGEGRDEDEDARGPLDRMAALHAASLRDAAVNGNTIARGAVAELRVGIVSFGSILLSARPRPSIVVAVVMASLTACASIRVEPIYRCNVPAGGPPRPAHRPPWTFAGWKPGDQQKLEEALCETWGVLTSPEFVARLESTVNLYDGPKGQPMRGPEVLDLLMSNLVPVTYVMAAPSSHQTASTGVSVERASTTLGVENVTDRWPAVATARDELERSCLVNTLAHEWTHAVPGPYDGYRIVDGDHKRSPVPLVSYTVGSIAQCAYLERKQVIKAEKFWACVGAVGTTVFNAPSVCGDAWLAWLSDGSAAPGGRCH